MGKEIVTLKGSKDGVTVILDDICSWEELIERLNERLHQDSSFLHGAELIVKYGNRVLDDKKKLQIQKMILNTDLALKKFLGGKDETLESEEKKMQDNAAGPLEEIMSETKSILVKRNLRSGQSVKYHGSIILLGDVNPGAELIATGNIIVMGVLRGVVHAGAQGDQSAVVAALRLQPTQLRIANYITRAPEEEPQQAEVARVKDGVVVVEKFQNFGDKLLKIC